MKTLTIPNYLLLSILIIFAGLADLNAQDGEIIPRWLTDEERSIMHDYIAPGTLRGETTPPPGPVRTMAEWEELQALVITWRGFTSILTEIVRYAKKEVEVIIVTNNPSGIAGFLQAQGIDNTNITFLNEPTNTVWVRDYGPNSVYHTDIDSLYIVDWIYNRPRPGDDLIPDAVGELLSVPVFSNTVAPYDLVHTGGNFMSDGYGTGFSSNLVLEENGSGNIWGSSTHDEVAVDSIMKRFMGIDSYVKMTNLPYDGIHHIDMHMKLLDERTLIVGEYPDGVADGPQIEANIQYVLNSFNTPSGKPYRVVRVPMPPDFADRYPDQNGDYRTYTNMIFINETVLVPVYEEKYDTTGLRIIQEALPGYNVVGIDCNEIIPYGGALHCITKEVGTKDPLWIGHEVLDDISEPQPTGYPVSATVKHRSGIDSVLLFYQTNPNATVFSKVTMTPSPNDPAIWNGIIPALDSPATVHYYFHAFAQSGKEQKRPLPAPEGYFNFTVEDVTTSWYPLGQQAISMNVFPNPARANTCIELTSEALDGNINLRLLNANGQIHRIWKESNIQKGKNHFFFNAEELNSGVYFIELINDHGTIIQKVIVH